MNNPIKKTLSIQPIVSLIRWFDTEGVWHRNLMNSTGLTRQPRKHADITKTPDWVQEMYHEFLPHYEYMHSHRLQPTPQGAV